MWFRRSFRRPKPGHSIPKSEKGVSPVLFAGFRIILVAPHCLVTNAPGAGHMCRDSFHDSVPLEGDGLGGWGRVMSNGVKQRPCDERGERP